MSDVVETGRSEVVPGERRRLRLLQATTFTSNVDRFAITPLLVPIGLDLHAPLTAVAAVAAGYFLAYGLMQLVWGIVSDRVGRVRVMRISLCGAAVAGACSVVAPNLVVLGVARVITGACFAGVIPTALVYVGDVWPAATRQRPVSEVLTASATGIALATVGAGVLADLVGWRVVPGLSAAAAAALAVTLRLLPEPDRPATAHNPLRSIRAVLRSGWAQLVLVVVLAEGFVVLGVLTYVAPAVQALGKSAAIAGLVAAAFGVGAVACSRLVRALVARVSPAGMTATGGLCLVIAWAVPAVTVSVATLVVAGLGVGASWAFLHTTLQTWATEMVPGERATSVALFATSLFLGSAIGTAVLAPEAEAGAYGTVFVWATACAVPVAVIAWRGRRRWDRRPLVG
ncbi:MAG: MFS transporter [Pseudonocardiales bacterium]|nr:MFS transporter [Pseudonocardiales bacterium]